MRKIIAIVVVLSSVLLSAVLAGKPPPPPVFGDPLPVPKFAEPLPVPIFDGEMSVENVTVVPERERDDGLVLVMVSSKRCLPCQTMRPILDRVGGKWTIRYVDFDDPNQKQWIELYGIESVPFFVAYRGHEALEEANELMSLEEVLGWLGRLEQGLPPDPGGKFRKCEAQASLKPVDREYLQMRLTPGSCGMLGCMAHGGGWVTEKVKDVPDEKKPKGHWETRPGACPTCPPQKVWVADPDETGTVPWNSGGCQGRFGRWRGWQ